MIFKCLC